jgi:lysophospholipase L1-like esterase
MSKNSSNLGSLFYVLGDSIAFGQHVSTCATWTTQLSAFLFQQSPAITTQVTAINGETTRESLARLEHSLLMHGPSKMWLQYGLNDAMYWDSERGHPRVSIHAFEANLREIIDRCQSAGVSSVFLATNHRVTKYVVNQVSGQTYSDNALEYNKVIRAVASAYQGEGVQLADMERLLAERFTDPADYLLADGVHLNQVGHDAYFKVSKKLTQVFFQAE